MYPYHLNVSLTIADSWIYFLCLTILYLTFVCYLLLLVFLSNLCMYIFACKVLICSSRAKSSFSLFLIGCFGICAVISQQKSESVCVLLASLWEMKTWSLKAVKLCICFRGKLYPGL